VINRDQVGIVASPMTSATVVDVRASARPMTRHGAPGNDRTQKTRRAVLRTGFQAGDLTVIKTPWLTGPVKPSSEFLSTGCEREFRRWQRWTQGSDGGSGPWAFHSLSLQLNHFDHVRKPATHSILTLVRGCCVWRVIAVNIERRRRDGR
jgi:hypothetical protein